MPIPLLFIAIAVGTGGLGIGKTIKAGVDTHKAKKVTAAANEILEAAKKGLNNARKRSGDKLKKLGLTKVEILDSSINRFVHDFEKIKNIDFEQTAGIKEINKLKIDKQALKELKEMGGFATSILGGVAGGAFGGALTAFGAYSAAGAFAAASTGAAISSLSGAAATNATLAFFGGGSIATGGLGVVGGTAVLGGLVAGPALAIMGFIVGAKASKAKDEAYANLALAKKNAAELNLGIDLCNAIASRCVLFCNLLNELDKRFKPVLDVLSETIKTYGTDYSKYPLDNKKTIAAAAAMAISIKSVLDTPILTKDGQLTSDSAKILSQYESKPKRINKITTRTPHLSLEEIAIKCSSERYHKSENANSTSFFSLFGKISWGQYLKMVNEIYGVGFSEKDFKGVFEDYGNQEPQRLWSMVFSTQKLVCLYQVGQLTQKYSKKDILNSMVVSVDDINWDGLLKELKAVYGIDMAVWQLTSGKDSTGHIAPNSVFEQVVLKIIGQPDSFGKHVLYADEFQKALG
jgi:hypothetical protein